VIELELYQFIGIGTLSIYWNWNRYYDCCWYLLYDNETG